MEQWLPVVGYEGVYEVSDMGRVRSLDREVWRKSRSGNEYVWIRPGRVMKQHRIPDSPIRWRQYWQIRLHVSGASRHHMVHRLVTEAFLGPLPPGMQCRHGPGGMLDNTLGNLCYGTAFENQADRVRDGTANIGSQNPNSKLTEEDVAQVRARRAAGESQKALAAEFEVSTATISMVVTGYRWKG